jgi:uracil-DNA glycosylase
VIDLDVNALAPGWRELIGDFLATPTGAKLCEFLARREADGARIYPRQPLRALTLTAFGDVRVVILGQDPYHGAGQAHGLAFSVPAGVTMPPSLRNIHAEVERDLGCRPPTDALERWARQGVLLLNAVLTVEEGEPGSHGGRGWEILTGEIVRRLAVDARPKVFMLWGAIAQAQGAAIGVPHQVLLANHPSPLSARRAPVPFIGCRHFSRANEFLVAAGQMPIDWC